MLKRLVAGLSAIFFLSIAFTAPAFAQGTTQFGPLIDGLPVLTAPVLNTDKIPMQRSNSATGFQAPATTFLQNTQNLGDIKTKGAASMQAARSNLGIGASVSILDYPGVDPTGATSSDAAFTSCITSGNNCYLPPGTYKITCSVHNATNNIMIYGDNPTSVTLKVPTPTDPIVPCTMPTGGLINLANMQNLTVDVNNNAPTSLGRILSNFTNGGAAVNFTPSYQNLRVINGNTNMFLIDINAFSNGSVFNPIVRNNFLQLTTASGASQNECIVINVTGTSIISGGEVSQNICSNTGMDFSSWDLTVSDNDISGWKYNAGITIEQNANSYSYHIINNRVHDSGTANDVNGTVLNGIVNWGQTSQISNNRIWNAAGACIDNGGAFSTISGNWCENSENRVDTFGNAAYFSLYTSPTFNGNNSAWVGNTAFDNRGAGAKMVVGYQDSINNTGVQLSGFLFPIGITTPYVLN